jgi:hypothetical protein
MKGRSVKEADGCGGGRKRDGYQYLLPAEGEGRVSEERQRHGCESEGPLEAPPADRLQSVRLQRRCNRSRRLWEIGTARSRSDLL